MASAEAARELGQLPGARPCETAAPVEVCTVRTSQGGFSGPGRPDCSMPHGTTASADAQERLRRLRALDSAADAARAAQQPAAASPRVLPRAMPRLAHNPLATPRITVAKVLDIKPMEIDAPCQARGAEQLASGTHTPVVETVLLDPRSAIEPEAEAAAPGTPVERGEPERSSIRSMLEEIVEQKVSLALDSWRGTLQALVEERVARLAEALENEREARLREQGELGASLQRSSERLARLEEAAQRAAAVEAEQAQLLEKSLSLAGTCGGQQEDNFRYNPTKQIVGVGGAVPWCDFTDLRLEFNALQSKVEELAAADGGGRACQVGFDVQRNNTWQDLEARSPSPGGRSAKLEAARASRHGAGAVGRKSQGSPSGATELELARRLSAAGPQAQSQGAGLTLPGAASKLIPPSKLRRSASELPGQRLPLSPRSGCATARGTPAPEPRPAGRCGAPRPGVLSGTSEQPPAAGAVRRAVRR